MFARKSKKNVVSKQGKINWFDYGSLFYDYQKGSEGIKIHNTTRFFDPKTGTVWLPKENLLVKVCKVPENIGEEDGLVYTSGKSKCDFMETPLCSDISFVVRKNKLKKSKQPPWEFLMVLEARGIKEDVGDSQKAVDVYRRYFE